MTKPMDEIPLAGGDVTEVYRVGDTVRRQRGPHSDAVAVLLRHLESVGFEGAPRYLGVDDKGRDTLSYVEGDCPGRPMAPWVAGDAECASVGVLLRRYHDAVAPLGIPVCVAPDARPRAAGEPPGTAPAASLMGHRDLTPENTIFRRGRAFAFVDFDLARPSAPIEDVINLLQWWAPFMPSEDRPAPLVDVDPGRRGRLLVDAYGLADADRRLIIPPSINAAQRNWHSMRWRADTLGGGWARMWYEEDAGGSIRRREAWLRANGDALTAALVG